MGSCCGEALFDERVRPPDLLPPSKPVPWGAAVVAASRPELARVTWRFGTLGARIYHKIYGRLTARTRPAATVSDIEPVSRSDFAVVWGRASAATGSARAGWTVRCPTGRG
ncbi:hypothetical protein [Streptomyces sp. KL116D]|uniref:hypothetical protein n=1 Tax=Streptomyces sp. KL116D TaxID=3045152 RepID=UPI0035564AB2